MTKRRAILTALGNVHPYLMPTPAVWADASALLVQPQPTQTEVLAELQRLEGHGLVIGITNPEGAAKWKLSDAGRAELAER